MRKGSSKLGSLGAIRRAAAVAGGIALLILPIYATVGALFAPVPSWAQEQEASAPAAVGSSAVRDAVERRSQSWLDQANELASRRRVVKAVRKSAAKEKALKVIQTRATWYGPGFHGHRTASGERFNQNAMTLASRHLPFGTRVRVVNPRTGRSAIARVNDRGPFRSGYTADLSKGLAYRIGMLSSGPVRIEILPKK
jgi:rare lipoprotein A (peptidoglycan hydrolase)